MASARELMAPPPMSSELIADIKFMARQRSDIDSDMRQRQPMSTEEQAHELHEGISQLFDRYGSTGSDSLTMFCRGIGTTVYEVEFVSDPIGIANLSVDEWVIKNGLWRLKHQIRNDIIVPTDQNDGFYARLVQTSTPINPLFKSLEQTKSARATASEVTKAKWLMKLALNHGRVKTT